MKASSSIALVLVALFFPFSARCASKGDTSSEALIAKARSQQVWDEQTPPLHMKAKIEIANADGTSAQGDYFFDWVSPTQWREEIKFANYERLRVRDTKGYWQKSSLDFQPMLIYELSGMLHEKDVLRIRSEQTLGKVKSREKDGVRQACTAVNWPRATDRILCFDENGALISSEYPPGRVAASPFSRIEYASFHSIGAKLIPFQVREFNDKRAIATMTVLEMTELKEVKVALFTPPSDAELWPQCNDMQVAEPIERPSPNYSSIARTIALERVILYGVVEEDGSVSHVTVIQSGHPDRDKAAMEAFRHWRYKPAQCGQTPIRTETSMYFDFLH